MKQQAQLKIDYVPIDDLLEYRGNAKLHPSSQIDQIASSIEEFNFNNPILAWHNEDGEPEIVAGHGRLMAARKLGLQELPVVFLDHLSEEARRAYTLVDNQLTMNSGFDFGILQSELNEIVGIDMAQFDFNVSLDTVEIAEDYGGADENDEAYAPQSDTHFNYKEQYGVIVMCDGEDDQERVYNRLTEEGYTCKVVAV